MLALVCTSTGSIASTSQAGIYEITSAFRNDARVRVTTCYPAINANQWLPRCEAHGQCPSTDFTCGNQVPWPGAFALDGKSEVDVCLVWDRKRSAHARAAAELEPDAVCARLRRE